MEVSGVSPEASVKLQKSGDKQLEKVTQTILNGVKDAEQKSREFHSTGHSLNVTA